MAQGGAIGPWEDQGVCAEAAESDGSKWDSKDRQFAMREECGEMRWWTKIDTTEKGECPNADM
jgi:hypothetical protein